MKEGKMRQRFTDDMKAAMKSGEKEKLATIRLIIAALKEKDIEARGANREKATDDEIMALLQKMVKQRNESAEVYNKGGRPELAAKEHSEAAIIAAYLPAQMDDDAVKAAISAAISEIDAAGVKDMGKVIGVLKGKYAGQMDFAKASGLVKAMLS